MDLLWIAHDYKILVVGSSSAPVQSLYIYRFFFDRINNPKAAIKLNTEWGLFEEQEAFVQA